MDNLNPMEMFQPVFLVVWSFVIIFANCEAGEFMTKQFNQFDDELCQCNWYFFPIDLQRKFLVLILTSQQLTFFKGYGSIVCTRNSFKEVTSFPSKSILFFSFVISVFNIVLDHSQRIFLFYDASQN